MIEFKEATHFSWKQFTYMLTRNRSAIAGIKPYIRAYLVILTDSWVADFIKWYIDQDTGYAIQSRGGKIRYFVIVNDEPIWSDDLDELLKKYNIEPKSFTFIPSSIYDNKILLKMTRIFSEFKSSRYKLLKNNY